MEKYKRGNYVHVTQKAMNTGSLSHSGHNAWL